jgi:hypothetical protein
LAVALAAGLVGMLCGVSRGALAKANGGSGYSGQLSSNAILRKQQLICDPATAAATTSPFAQGAPVRGSTSVTYDPRVVHLSAVQLGTGYSGSGLVEVVTATATGVRRTFLQDLASFLKKPSGQETGYVQVLYHTGAKPAGQRADDLFGPTGQPGQIAVARGYKTVATAGVQGFDTHAFLFNYWDKVSSQTLAKYTVYADVGGQHSGNKADFLVGLSNGREFTLRASQLKSATVRGSLLPAVQTQLAAADGAGAHLAAVPLPPGAWTGAATLLAAGFAARRRRVV